jgi:DNA-binding MarR family transcriptional regulator
MGLPPAASGSWPTRPAKKGNGVALPSAEVGAGPDRLTYIVKQVELAIRAGIERSLADMDVTPNQHMALSMLARKPGMSGADLARRLFVSPQAAHMTVLALEKRGLVARKTAVGDRRALSVHLTPAGLDLLRRCDKLINDLDAAMIAYLTSSAQAELRASLWSCVQALGEHAARNR